MTDELGAFSVSMEDKDGEISVLLSLKELNDDVYSTLHKFDLEKIEVGNV